MHLIANDLEPVSQQYRSVQEHVVAQLREQILSGNLKAGQRLVVRDLTEKLQVSATPVRLALAQLASESFVRVISPHRGVEVCGVNPEEVEELYLMRIELEKLALRLAAQRKTEEDILRVQEVGRTFLEITPLADTVTYRAASDQFSSTLYAISRSERLLKSIAELRLNSERYRRIFYQHIHTINFRYPDFDPEEAFYAHAHAIERTMKDFATGEIEWIQHDIEVRLLRTAKWVMKVVADQKLLE